MFGGSKKAPHIEEQDARDGQYRREWEYRSLAVIGIVNFDKQLNEHAQRGWELVNADSAGTTIYGFLRRRLKALGE